MSEQNETLEALKRSIVLNRAKQRAAAKAKSDGNGQAIPHADRSRPLPLSWAQQRLWFLDQLDPAAGAAYHMPVALQLHGALDRAALQASLDRIVARHENLRTRFVSQADGPVQLVDAADIGFRLQWHDLSALLPDAQAQAVAAHSQEEAGARFDLAQGPLVRGRLLRLDQDTHVLLVTQHHIVSDGWSIGVLVQEVSALYAAFCQGQADPLPALSIQYADYAAWQRGWLQGERLQGQLDYWRSQLDGAPALLELPTDRPRPLLQRHVGDRVDVRLPAALSAGLRALSQRHGTTLFMTLLAGWSALLSRLSGQSQVVIGSPVANRTRRELEPLIGFFVNTLALRVNLEAAPTVADLLAQVKATTLAAYDHQDLPFEQVVEAVQPVRSMSHSPLFQVMLTMNNTPAGGGLSLASLRISAMASSRPTAHFDLALSLNETTDGIAGNLEYASDLFERRTVERFVACLQTLLGAMCADDRVSVMRLPLLTRREREDILEGFNRRSGETGMGMLLQDMIQAHALHAPEAIALQGQHGAMTYATLNLRANQLAHRLISAGIRPDDRVAICGERSFEMIVGLLAILKAGGAYVPLDPSYPADRLAYMLADSGPVALLTQSHLQEQLPWLADARLPTYLLDEPEPSPQIHAADPVVPDLRPDHLAYVIYTSGSTGQPKGVAIEHRNIVAQALTHIRTYGLHSQDRTLHFASFCFDSSVIELFPALCVGATVVLRPPTMIAPDEEFVRFLSDQQLSVIDLPTAFWHAWVQEISALRSLPPPGLRLMAVGGEKVERRHLQAWLESPATAGCRWLNMYGPTEATVDTTSVGYQGQQELPPGEVSIGKPLANVRVYLLDECHQPVPVGVPAEIYVGGVGVARGYLNRTELTSERFFRDPFVDDPTARMYRTGDLGRWQADGSIDYIGRNDAQVKIRGFRIELGEIEAHLSRCEGVREAVVIAREDTPGRKFLAAYLVAHDHATLSIAGLKETLARDLAEYMVPATYTFLDALPLSPNGKIDRNALPVPVDSALQASAYVAPQGQYEQAVAQVWGEVLGRERIGRNDHFFELGGHSLLAVQAVSRLRQALAIQIPLRDLFTWPTPAALGARLGETQKGSVQTIVRADRMQRLPLSWAQQRLWFLDRLDPAAGAAYHMPVALRLRGQLDRGALRAALDCIVARHEVLRTHIASESGQAWQVIGPVEQRFALTEVDLSALSASTQAERVRTLAREEAHARFDLATGPLIRGQLLVLDTTTHVLLVTQHHIVSDGWSVGILIREFSALYDALCKGAAAPLQALELQYGDFAAWQRGWLQGEILQRQLSYWRDRLEGAPALLELTTDRARPALQSYAGGRVPVRLSPSLSESLKALSRRHGTTVFMTLLAAWSVLLSRLSGQAEVVVGTPVANRMRPELEPLIGFFVNTLALRVDVGGAADVADLLAQVKATTLGAYEHQDLPFEQVVEAVQPVRSMSHSPLFQAMLSMNNTPGGNTGMRMHGLELDTLDSGQASTHFDLELAVSDTGQALIGNLVYATDLFDASTAERHVACLETLLQALCAHEGALVSLPWLPSPERERVLEVFNATSMPRPMTLIHHAFEEQARATPDAVALECGGVTLCYAELNRRANQVAHRLAALGARPDARVAICAERGLDMVVGLLGILKSGAAYVPLDPTHPRERLAGMLADCAPTAVLAQPSTLGLLPQEAQVPTLVLTARVWEDAPTHDLQVAGLTPQHLAYVIYTSGSTGQPKGVMNEHHAVMNRLHWGKTQFPWMVGERVLHKTPFGFDVSVWEIFQPLLSGARLVLAQPQGHQDPDYLIALIESAQITVAHFVPSMLQAFLDRLPAGRCAGLRQIFCSGEALGLALAAQVRSKLPQVELHNLYGPTEAAIEVTWWNCAEGTTRPAVPIGRPIANTRMYVLDGQGEPVPVGVAGELCIGGVQVARGYWNRAQLSAERFVPDRFSADPQARMYRTGDLGRWRADGTIEYLGRNDFQVKIRGFRIELGEIEAQLLACADVREAVVVARAYGEGDTRLVAYVVMAPGVACDVSALRQALLQRLAEYMVPSAFVALEALPLTANGKLDRQALPSPETAAVAVRAYEAPHGEIEEAIAAIWQDLLGVERVGRHDHFFELGGHSLLAVQVASRLHASLQLEVPLRELFARPTLSALAASLDSTASPAPSRTSITLADRSRPLPLSWAQQRLWFLDQLDPAAGAAYHMPVALQLHGALDRAALQASLDRIVARHENLRTRFVSQADGPVQLVDAADIGFRLQWHDLSALLPDAQAQAVAAHSQEEAGARFDLAQGPLVRGRLLRLDQDTHVLLVTQHHIVSDGWSIGVLVQEVSALYAAFCQGQADPLPALSIQYADYAAWQRGWLQGDTLQGHLQYWRAQLAGAPALLELPVDRPRPQVQRYAGERLAVHLPAALSTGLRALSQRHGTTLFMTLLAGWSALLSRLSGQSQVVIGSPVANRTRRELEPLIGFFVNTLALRVNLEAAPTVADLLAQVKATTLAAYDHQDLPFEQVVEAVQPVRSLRHSPLFQVMLSLNNTPDRGGLQLPGLTLEQMPSPAQTAQFDLSLSLVDQGQTLSGSLVYASDLFDRATVERMLAQWQTLLAAMVADAHGPLMALPLLEADERAQVLGGFHAQAHAGRAQTFSPGLVHAGFEAHAARTPHATAVRWEGQTLSYGELERRANQVAHRLIALGVRPDERVALCVERGLELVVGLIGILKAGAGYVPLDPAYPGDRLAYMLADSAPVAVLTQIALAAMLPATSVPILALDQAAQWQAQPVHAPDPAQLGLQPHHLAYVIYTSGSTGQPKGVMVEHAQVSRLFAATEHWFNFGPQDVWTLFHSYAFDFSVWELWGALNYGGRLVVVPSLCARAPAEFYTLLVTEQVTVLNQTPSAFRALSAAAGAGTHALRLIVFGGEALEPAMLADWVRHTPTSSTQLVNMYGITEITVHATHRSITEADILTSHGSPIGQAIPDLRLYVLDAGGEPVPVGVSGELYVSGAGVARGYLNRPALSAERFVPDRFSTDPQARMYRTGDLGRWRADGTIEYLGRNDFQVKIRGYRIELGEIEARLGACAGVREAVVIAREDSPGDKRLVAYVVMESGQACEVHALRQALARDLAEYMLPSAFVALEALPLTTNGKLDRQALPVPDQSAVLQRPFEAAQGEREQALAQVWQELLTLEQVSRHDHFFELGGHSLLVVSLIERLRQRGWSIDVRAVFMTPVLMQLATLLQSTAAAVQRSVAANPITPATERITPDLLPLVSLSQVQIDAIVASIPGGAANVQDIYPLGPLQEGILFHHLIDSERPGDPYLVRSLFAFDRREKLDAFVAALQQVIERHDILRSAPRWQGLERPVQVVHRRAPLPMEVLSPVEGSSPMQALLKVSDPARIKLDLEKAPLLRIQVVEDTASGQWRMALLNHHLVDDNYSMQLLYREIRTILQGHAHTLPPPEPYRTFIARAVDSDDAGHEAHFRKQLGSVTEPTAPFGVLDIHGEAGYVRRARVDLPSSLTTSVREQARASRVTPAVLFHVAWAMVLARLIDRADVVFGTVLSGRLQGSEAADEVVGMFINTLPLRLDLTGCTVTDAVQHAQQALGELLQHEQASLTLAQRCSGVRAPLPLFTTLLNYRHSHLVEDGEESIEVWDGIHALGTEERTNYPIGACVDDLGTGFTLTAQTCGSIDAKRVVAYLLQATEGLVTALAGEAAVEALSVDVMPVGERMQLLEAFARSPDDMACGRPETLVQLFEAQVARRPDAVALYGAFGHCRYDDLDRIANHLARALREQGVVRHDRIAVFAERGETMIQALLGVLKAGAVYVPMDPDYPAERLTFMLEDSAPSLVLATRAAETQVRRLGFAGTVIVLEDMMGPSARRESEHCLHAQEAAAQPNDAAYMIYTSGSTGRPKAAINRHAGVSAMIRASLQAVGIDDSSRILQFASPSFDGSVFEIFVSLCSGAALCLADRESLRPGDALVDTLRRFEISHVAMPASALQACGAGAAIPSSITLMLGGEVLPPALARAWASTHRLFNLYGPTETAVTSTFHRCLPDAETHVPIGRPLGHCRLYVLDEQGRLSPIGVPGELHVGGVAVGLGYWKREALTAERFVEDPFMQTGAGRMYRTGDKVRWCDNGEIEYLGRNDFQIKLRGFRIELGEIEARLGEIPGIRACAVVARDHATGLRLVAYVVPEKGVDLDAGFLRQRLALTLAEFMLPSAFVQLAELPLSPNGKLDRTALPAPDQAALAQRPYVAPRTPDEQALARLWSELLGTDRVGCDDHFFELGGHSLSAIRLAYLARERLGATLSLATVFASPTLSAMAETLHGSRRGQYDPAAPATQTLVTMLAGDTGAPALFCIHPIGGQVARYLPLAQRLSTHWQVFGVRSAEVVDLGESPSLDALALQYAQAIQHVRPRGPYHLLGWSTGGMFAAAVATALQAQGAVVEYLGWIDTHTTAIPADTSTAYRYAAMAELRGSRYTLRDTGDAADLLLARLPTLTYEEASPLLEAALQPAMDRPTFEHLQTQIAVGSHHLQLLRDFSQTALMKPTQQFRVGGGEDEAALDTHPNDVVWMEGDHYTLLAEPQVGQLAEALCDWRDARSPA